MGLIERSKSFLSRLHDEIFYQEALKIKARQIIDETSRRAQLNIDLGLIDEEKLQLLADDPEFEKTYQRLWKLINKPEFDWVINSMTFSERTAVGLRHAEYLRRRWFPDEAMITLDFTRDPKLPTENIQT